MPQLAAEAAQQDTQLPVAGKIAHDQTTQQTGQHGLAHVEQNDAQSISGAVGAVEIGQSGVAAAVLPHVIPDDKVTDHHRAVETAQKIAQQQQNEP